jgi:hypothetical protein
VGEEVFMGGGIGSSSGLPTCVIQQLSSRCDGPFWFVGEGVRLNIQRDSKLVEIEVISSDDRDGILLTKHTILDEWVDERSVIKGKLVLYKPMRCPRLKSDSGITDYLLIWPPDYYLQIVDGLVEIRNGSGEIVAQEGLEIVLHGGSIPHRWDSEQYRQLYYNIPGDCYGPYWIVREIP